MPCQGLWNLLLLHPSWSRVILWSSFNWKASQIWVKRQEPLLLGWFSHPKINKRNFDQCDIVIRHKNSVGRDWRDHTTSHKNYTTAYGFIRDQQVESIKPTEINTKKNLSKNFKKSVQKQKQKKRSTLFFWEYSTQGSRRQTALLHNGFHWQLQNSTLWGDDDPLFLGDLQQDEITQPINKWFFNKDPGIHIYIYIDIGSR